MISVVSRWPYRAMFMHAEVNFEGADPSRAITGVLLRSLVLLFILDTTSCIYAVCFVYVS